MTGQDQGRVNQRNIALSSYYEYPDKAAEKKQKVSTTFSIDSPVMITIFSRKPSRCTAQQDASLLMLNNPNLMKSKK